MLAPVRHTRRRLRLHGHSRGFCCCGGACNNSVSLCHQLVRILFHSRQLYPQLGKARQRGIFFLKLADLLLRCLNLLLDAGQGHLHLTYLRRIFGDTVLVPLPRPIGIILGVLRRRLPWKRLFGVLLQQHEVHAAWTVLIAWQPLGCSRDSVLIAWQP